MLGDQLLNMFSEFCLILKFFLSLSVPLFHLNNVIGCHFGCERQNVDLLFKHLNLDMPKMTCLNSLLYIKKLILLL